MKHFSYISVCHVLHLWCLLTFLRRLNNSQLRTTRSKNVYFCQKLTQHNTYYDYKTLEHFFNICFIQTNAAWLFSHAFNRLILQGCQPYLIKPLKKSELHKSSTQCFQTPMCIKSKCTNSNFQPLKEKPVYFKSE